MTLRQHLQCAIPEHVWRGWWLVCVVPVLALCVLGLIAFGVIMPFYVMFSGGYTPRARRYVVTAQDRRDVATARAWFR